MTRAVDISDVALDLLLRSARDLGLDGRINVSCREAWLAQAARSSSAGATPASS